MNNLLDELGKIREKFTDLPPPKEDAKVLDRKDKLRFMRDEVGRIEIALDDIESGRTAKMNPVAGDPWVRHITAVPTGYGPETRGPRTIAQRFENAERNKMFEKRYNETFRRSDDGKIPWMYWQDRLKTHKLGLEDVFSISRQCRTLTEKIILQEEDMAQVRRALATTEPTLKMLSDRMLDEDAYHVRMATSQRALEKKIDFLVHEHRSSFDHRTYTSEPIDLDTYGKSLQGNMNTGGRLSGMGGMRNEKKSMGTFDHLSQTKINKPVWQR